MVAQNDWIEQLFCIKGLSNSRSYYNSREYSDNMITALNNLKITLGITLVHQQEFDTETSQKYMNLNIKPIEKLIQEREKEKYDEMLNTKKKKYKEKIKEAEEQKEKVTKQQTLKSLSFWRRHPKLTYTLGIITGGFICGFGTYYAHDIIAKIFGKTVEASLKTVEATVETAAQS